MTCADVQRVLPEMMEGGQNSEIQAHLATCNLCSELVSDLEFIASEARKLADSEEPSPRVWLGIANELRAEGLIREPGLPARRPVLAPAAARWWRNWWLVPVAAALLVAGSYMLKPKPAGEVATQKNPDITVPQPITVAKSKAAPATSAEDQQLLDEVSQRAPMMKATYENELRSVNSYIRDAQVYAQQNPQDEDARQQVMDAYQQKAMLYQMALDHIQ